VFYPIDAEKGEGVELAKKYSIIGYPTYIVVNADGATLDRWIGYEKKSWIVSADQAIADPTTIDEKLARYEKRPTATDAVKLAGYHDSRGEYQDAVKLYRAAADLDPSSADAYRMSVFESMFYGMRKKQFTPDEFKAAADAVFAEKEPKASDLLDVASYMGYAASSSDGKLDPVPYLKRAVEETEGVTDPDVVKSRAGLLPDYALHVLEDPDKAVTYEKAILPEKWMEDPGQLNRFAWWCFENTVNLEEAETLAQKAVDLAEPGKEKAMILDTLAEICNARGDCGQALALSRRAVQEDPAGKHYKAQVERFEKLSEQGTNGSGR
jgi:tetratricopeptide (TPR) repeat protein